MLVLVQAFPLGRSQVARLWAGVLFVSESLPVYAWFLAAWNSSTITTRDVTNGLQRMSISCSGSIGCT